jgi:hypothetical protein
MSQVYKRILTSMKKLFGLGSDPDFFILGAQKAGTTSLFNYLINLGVNFKPPKNKELYFFSEYYNLGMKFYRSNFPIFKRNSQITGEATPDYLFFHKCPKLLHQEYPKAKLIIILRDPVLRAFSQYNHQNFTNKTRAYDPVSFGDAIRREEARFCVQDESSFFYEYKYFSYKKRGLYEEQIRRWLEFFDIDQMMFLDISELKSPEMVKQVCDFLNIETRADSSGKISKKYNTNALFEMPKNDEEYLTEFYRGCFDELESITGRTYPWLKKYLSHRTN